MPTCAAGSLLTYLALALTLPLAILCFQSLDEPIQLYEHPAPRHEAVWHNVYQQQLSEVRAADKEGSVDVIFYGDSISEAWRGQDLGQDCWRCEGVAAVYQQYFASKHKSLVMAISADQTAHLLWRLLNGHFPTKHPTKAAVIMIGTNDLGLAFESGGEKGMMDNAKVVTSRIREMAQYISSQAPDTAILLVGLLPRADRVTFAWPSVHMKGLQAVNKELQKFETELWMLGNPVAYAECGPPFIRGTEVDRQLMPDGLHPNAAGMELLAQCISRALDPLLAAHPGASRGSG